MQTHRVGHGAAPARFRNVQVGVATLMAGQMPDNGIYELLQRALDLAGAVRPRRCTWAATPH